MPRLLFDGDLDQFEPQFRDALRKSHRQVYRKNLRLIARDISAALRIYRGKMAKDRQWDFPALLIWHSRAWKALAILMASGIIHALDLPAPLQWASTACLHIQDVLLATQPKAIA